MADIARRAGVGIGTLYRRYPSKEALVLQLCLDGMRRLEEVTRTALAQLDGDPWEAFAGYMNAALDAGAGALGAALAGTFTPTPELLGAARDLYAAGGELIDRAQEAGALRGRRHAGGHQSDLRAAASRAARRRRAHGDAPAPLPRAHRSRR